MLYFLVFMCVLFAADIMAEPAVSLQQEDCLFVTSEVPDRGVVCSNLERAKRLSKYLENPKVLKSSWGPRVYVGIYQGVPIFIAAAPVGSGSGLVFSELYTQGAKYIIRFGSDDIKNPKPYEFKTAKVIDEADHLYGFSFASGVAWESCGASIPASTKLIRALEEEATARKLTVEKRICHHLENYHAMRLPHRYVAHRQEIMTRYAPAQTDKKESIDMETAVLFQVASDFDQHAVSVLQTVNKENGKDPYNGPERQKALAVEKEFAKYIFAALLRVK